MKYVILAILFFLIEHNALAQNVTISEQHVTLVKIMKLIRKQTGYYFSLGSGVTGTEKKVSLVVKDVPLKVALDRLTSDKAYTYVIIDSIIVIIDRRKKFTTEIPAPFIIKGRVENENGEPLQYATVSVTDTGYADLSKKWHSGHQLPDGVTRPGVHRSMVRNYPCNRNVSSCRWHSIRTQ